MMDVDVTDAFVGPSCRFTLQFGDMLVDIDISSGKLLLNTLRLVSSDATAHMAEATISGGVNDIVQRIGRVDLTELLDERNAGALGAWAQQEEHGDLIWKDKKVKLLVFMMKKNGPRGRVYYALRIREGELPSMNPLPSSSAALGASSSSDGPTIALCTFSGRDTSAPNFKALGKRQHGSTRPLSTMSTSPLPANIYLLSLVVAQKTQVEAAASGSSLATITVTNTLAHADNAHIPASLPSAAGMAAPAVVNSTGVRVTRSMRLASGNTGHLVGSPSSSSPTPHMTLSDMFASLVGEAEAAERSSRTIVGELGSSGIGTAVGSIDPRDFLSPGGARALFWQRELTYSQFLSLVQRLSQGTFATSSSSSSSSSTSSTASTSSLPTQFPLCQLEKILTLFQNPYFRLVCDEQIKSHQIDQAATAARLKSTVDCDFYRMTVARQGLPKRGGTTAPSARGINFRDASDAVLAVLMDEKRHGPLHAYRVDDLLQQSGAVVSEFLVQDCSSPGTGSIPLPAGVHSPTSLKWVSISHLHRALGGEALRMYFGFADHAMWKKESLVTWFTSQLLLPAMIASCETAAKGTTSVSGTVIAHLKAIKQSMDSSGGKGIGKGININIPCSALFLYTLVLGVYSSSADTFCSCVLLETFGMKSRNKFSKEFETSLLLNPTLGKEECLQRVEAAQVGAQLAGALSLDKFTIWTHYLQKILNSFPATTAAASRRAGGNPDLLERARNLLAPLFSTATVGLGIQLLNQHMFRKGSGVGSDGATIVGEEFSPFFAMEQMDEMVEADAMLGETAPTRTGGAGMHEDDEAVELLVAGQRTANPNGSYIQVRRGASRSQVFPVAGLPLTESSWTASVGSKKRGRMGNEEVSMSVGSQHSHITSQAFRMK
jgi:hypothetical protein